MKIAFTIIAVGCLLLVGSAVSAATSPAIVSAYGNEINVDGLADATSGPIVIFDQSDTTETRIGAGDVSKDGHFAAIVKPPLIAGHKLVAVDSKGQRSAVFVIAPSRSGPVPGTPGTAGLGK